MKVNGFHFYYGQKQLKLPILQIIFFFPCDIPSQISISTIVC